MATISTKGFDEYLERIVAAGRDVDEAAARAVLAGAEVAQEGIQTPAPVLTGNLSDHIKIFGPVQDGNYVSCSVGVIHDLRFTDPETARYANAQEYGTSSMPAHPYIRPTMDEDKAKLRAAIKQSLIEDGTL